MYKSILLWFYRKIGCWESSGKEDCNSPVCVAYRRPPKAMNDTKFCCCSRDFCNNNISVGYDDTRVEYSTATHVSTSEKQTNALCKYKICHNLSLICFNAYLNFIQNLLF